MPRKRVKRYRDFWYQSVVDMIKSYKKLDKEPCGYTKMYKDAIDKAFEYFSQFEYGDDLKKVIYMRYINNSHNVIGISDKIGVSVDTVKSWSQRFVYKVAEYVELPKRDIKPRYHKKRIEDVHV
ncbi:MAG: hypothetical protein MJ097_00510 [Dorea sp.]|nr:hypothetical protein [Dorea sp.]